VSGMIFSARKAAQAAAVLLKAAPAPQMEYMRLIKELYLADRVSFRKTGFPITGDHYFSMKNGPVLSEVYDLIKGKHCDVASWDAFLKTDGYSIAMIEDPSNDLLSEEDIDILHYVSSQLRPYETMRIVEKMHNKWCPEWKRPVPPMRRSEITIESILAEVGHGEEVESIKSDLRALEVANSAAERLKPRSWYRP